MQESERKNKCIERLPTNLKMAIDALGGDDVLMRAMGDVLAREYLLIKSADWENSKDKDVALEQHQYIHRY
jgi:glutamine synthetase